LTNLSFQGFVVGSATLISLAHFGAFNMLSTVATGLAIDAYGRTSDNDGGIAEIAGMSHRIRERTDALHASGNTTVAISKVLLIKFYFNCLMLLL
jgi:Na+/H+-translocating membrane pyrophosphatase